MRLRGNKSEKEINLMLFSIPMTFQTLTGIHKPRKHQILIAGPQILSKSHNYPHPLALIVYEHSFYPE